MGQIVNPNWSEGKRSKRDKTQPQGDPVFGAALKAKRIEQGLSQFKLGELIDVDHTYIARIEMGTRMPSRSVVTALAEVLGDEVMIAAGYIPPGYSVVKQDAA